MNQLNQRFLVVLLKVCGRHHDLVNRYKWPRKCSVCRNHKLSSFMINHRVCYKSSTTVAGADPGGAPEAPLPPKIGKIWFFGVKSWFFTRNTPIFFVPSSARLNLFECAPHPNLKSWIRPWVVWLCLNFLSYTCSPHVPKSQPSHITGWATLLQRTLSWTLYTTHLVKKYWSLCELLI
jgi:hypothetical protein